MPAQSLHCIFLFTPKIINSGTKKRIAVLCLPSKYSFTENIKNMADFQNQPYFNAFIVLLQILVFARQR